MKTKNFESNHKFNKNLKNRVQDYKVNKKLKKVASTFFTESVKNQYSYNFNWLGLPIIQYPQDIITIQEIIYQVKPNIIVETGIARGGSVLFLASMLMLLENEAKFKANKKKFKVLSIDIQIRNEIKLKLKNHFLSKYYKFIEKSSISSEANLFVSRNVKKNDKVLLILDSNHSEDHVFNELLCYSKYVSKGSYIIVMDTAINNLSNKYHKNKEWSKNKNPKTAIDKFINNYDKNKKFKIDEFFENKSLITNCPLGFLKKIK